MKILVIDDDKMICFALKTIIESNDDMEVVAIGHSYEDALALFKEHAPDLCLFDIRMGEKTGIDALRDIKKEHPDAKIIFLTTFLDDDYIKNALSLGSYGYLLKEDFESITPALRAVSCGQSVFGSKVIGNMNRLNDKRTENKNLSELLSEREIEVLKLVAEGLNNKEIAETLFLSEGTVRNYVSSMLDKLALRDRTQLAIFYYNGKV